MANTYSQMYIQIVFAVKHRECLIRPEWEVDLYRYFTGVIKNKGQKLLAINGMPDHIHIFINLMPSCCLSDLVREVKKASTVFINENHLSRYHFSWQEGFGSFSYHRTQIPMICHYIARQKEHHKVTTFKDEYLELLKEFSITYDQRYLFQWISEEMNMQESFSHGRQFPADGTTV